MFQLTRVPGLAVWIVMVASGVVGEQGAGPQSAGLGPQLALQPGANQSLALLRAISDSLTMGGNNQLLGGILERLVPQLAGLAPAAAAAATPTQRPAAAPAEATATTSTSGAPSAPSAPSDDASAANPLDQLLLGRNFESLGQSLASGSKMIAAPLKVLNGLMAGTAAIGAASSNSVDRAADKLVRATESTSKAVAAAGRPVGSAGAAGAESADPDALGLYEFEPEREPYAVRRPKYFSRECQFRLACELGRLVKPMNLELARLVRANRLLQDLQNRYTRALTYGTLNGDCGRYYCVLVALLGGPLVFASGVSELVNRFANPDLYEGYGFS